MTNQTIQEREVIMADDKKDRKSGWKKAWEIAQTLGAGAGVVALQQVLQAAGDKAGKAAGKKIEEALGLSSEAAQKTFDDEIFFAKSLNESTLTEPEKSILKNWLIDLRETDPKLAVEFTRWVHNAMEKLARKKVVSAGKKGEPPLTDADHTEGIKVAESLFKDIVSAATPEEKLRALKLRDIRVIPKKPVPGVAFAQKTADKVKKNRKKNVRNLNKTSRGFAEWAKDLRDRQRR